MAVRARLPVEVNIPDLEGLAAVKRKFPDMSVEVVPSLRLGGVLVTAETWDEVAAIVVAALNDLIGTTAPKDDVAGGNQAAMEPAQATTASAAQKAE